MGSAQGPNGAPDDLASRPASNRMYLPFSLVAGTPRITIGNTVTGQAQTLTANRIHPCFAQLPPSHTPMAVGAEGLGCFVAVILLVLRNITSGLLCAISRLKVKTAKALAAKYSLDRLLFMTLTHVFRVSE